MIVVALVTSSCAALGVSGGCDGTEIIANFEQVGDLVEAANVQSSDVVIGSISDIELDESEWHARVTMCIDEGQRIPSDVEAVVRTTSLLGEKFVDLQALSNGPPYLRNGAVIDVDRTSKATELEDVFAQLATVLGTGNLHEINRFTAAQAKILRNHSGDLREVLSRFRRFTDVIVARKGDVAASIDSLDDVARTVLGDSAVLQRFLESFGEASGVLADQKEGLQDLLVSLDRFSNVSLRLLDATEEGLAKQFEDLRPVLRTAIANSRNLSEGLRTLGTFAQWFPESMPGDYLQLDVCQALETHTQGTTCPQADGNDRSRSGASRSNESSRSSPTSPSEDLERILIRPLEGKN
jgi:phospholipid/cholesterol/gamma-HCH transport system substrate-binding protein